MKKRSSSSHKWLKRARDDIYTKMAKKDGYRSRAAYKLEEIQRKYKIIRPNMKIVDLGASPGGWSQYVRKLIKGNGNIVALDILPMEPIAGVNFICGDFTEKETLDLLVEQLSEGKVDLVISDMAPNFSGIRAADQTRAVYLIELALDFVKQMLIDEGSFLVKVFQGEGIDVYIKELKECFSELYTIKPKASRSESAEVYLLARKFRQKRK